MAYFQKESMKTLNMSEIELREHLSKLSESFEGFSTQAQDSEFYSDLAKSIGKDRELLAIIPEIKSQPIANLFLAAVNYLLYLSPQSDLASFYPNHTVTINPGSIFPFFKKFCLENIEKIKELCRTRLVQTNEVRRCALLFPALERATRIFGREVHLVDVGASSGLNLLMDFYRISYADGTVVGNLTSTIELSCTLKGAPIVFRAMPDIISRAGIDLNPVDLNDEDEFLWALSLIWPDQTDRIERFKKAVAVLRKQPVSLKRGSGLTQLLAHITQIPKLNHICIMHSFTLNQFTKGERYEFEELLARASKEYRISRISLEWLGSPHPELFLETYTNGKLQDREKLAECHQHGAWINWLSL